MESLVFNYITEGTARKSTFAHAFPIMDLFFEVDLMVDLRPIFFLKNLKFKFSN